MAAIYGSGVLLTPRLESRSAQLLNFSSHGINADDNEVNPAASEVSRALLTHPGPTWGDLMTLTMLAMKPALAVLMALPANGANCTNDANNASKMSPMLAVLMALSAKWLCSETSSPLG